MCIVKSEDNEIGRVIFRQTGCQTPLLINGRFDDLPNNSTSLLYIHQYGLLDTCENLGSLFSPANVQQSGFSLKADTQGESTSTLQSTDFSLRGLSSIIGRSCRARIPYVDRNGVSKFNYACGSIAMVSERVGNAAAPQGATRRLIARHGHWWNPCWCPPWRWWCHRPRWCRWWNWRRGHGHGHGSSR
jgi:hypothetical protein